MTSPTYEGALEIERARGIDHDAEVWRRACEAMREACARMADEYAAVNIEAAGDTVLHDPILSGDAVTPENMAKANDMMIQGCIHSSMFHAAQNIAEAVRSLDIPEMPR